MIIDYQKPNIEIGGNMEEKLFDVDDLGMIFDILRSKMYSNPHGAVCREITCNARDAHREVGTPDLPIQIVLPNHLDWNYRVKDFGPGISPDRMENIFIRYTASSKRHSNVFCGGFGLGSKTPFSCTDSFAVITIHNNIKYQYSCYIDETKIGKLSLLSQEKTKEPNGTEIIVPVEQKDAHLFAEWTEHACRHWKIKPTIKGGTINWQTPVNILEGKDWAITKNEDYNRQVKMIIDGIEYPLALDTLRTYASTKLLDACRGNLLMYFGIGELTLSASREQIYLDKKTKDKINQRLDEIVKEIKKIIDAKIDSFPNLWQANIYYFKGLSQAFHNVSFLGKLKWKDIELHGKYVSISCPAFTFSRGRYSRKFGNDPNKLTRSRASSINFEENSEIFINDLPIPEPTPRHIKKAFEDNPKLISVQVICPTDTITEDSLNKLIHLDKMAPRRMSEITKATGRAYTLPSARLLVFKFDRVCDKYRQVSYDSIEEDTNDKVLCLLSKEGVSPYNRLPFITKDQTIALSCMRVIADKSDKVSFYGVDSELPTNRIEEEFGDFEKLNDYVERKILNNKGINYVEIKFATNHHYYTNDRILENISTLKKLIDDPHSIFIRRADLHQRIKDINAGDINLLNIFESIKGEITEKQTEQFLKNNPNWDLEKLNKEYGKTYPLLGAIEYYQYSNANMIEHIAQYVNLIDANNLQNKKTTKDIRKP